MASSLFLLLTQGAAKTPAAAPADADLIAFWDFTESAPPYIAKVGTAAFSLANGSGATVTSTTDGPFGGGAVFDGTSDYLTIPSANVGDLQLAQFGDTCTVVAWVARTDLDQGFIAGLWDEANSRRNFGLFLDLPTYGGDDQVCGHISNHGGATPGYPFNRDYAASARKIGSAGGYRFVALTYDGSQIVAYLDGLADARPSFTDNQSNTYAKNPYSYSGGLNDVTALSDFTVGGNLITGPAIGNFLTGKIGGLAVFRRVLTPDELLDLHRSALPAAIDPLVTFDWWTTTAGAQGEKSFGWASARGASGTDTTDNGAGQNNFAINQVSSPNGFLYRSGIGDATNTTTEGIGYYLPVGGMGLNAAEVAGFTWQLNNSLAADQMRLAIRIGTTWYASDTAFSVTGDGRTAADWSTAETKSLTMSLAANVWRALTFVPGTSLALGSLIATTIPDGPLTGVGFYSPSAAGVLRIDTFSVTSTGPVVSVKVPAAFGPVRTQDTAVSSSSSPDVPAAFVPVRSQDPTVAASALLDVPSALVPVRTQDASVATDITLGVPSALVTVVADPAAPGTAVPVPSAGVQVVTADAALTSSTSLDVPSAFVPVRVQPSAVAASALLDVPTALVSVAARDVTAATYYRYQWWDAPAWRPIAPVVWDGAGWVSIPVTLTEPD